MSKDTRDPMQKTVMVAFEVGFYAALICVGVVLLLAKFVRDDLEAARKAQQKERRLEQKSVEDRQVQSDVESDSGNRQRG